MPFATANVISSDINLVLCALELRHERNNGRPIDKVVKYSNGLVYSVSENPLGLNTNFYQFEIRPGFGQSSSVGWAVTTGSFTPSFLVDMARI